MYKVIWDSETGGILLVESHNDAIVPPRPVFYEELDLLGFDKYWNYPRIESPLLWAIGRRYYYKGKLVAEAKGGGVFESPQIEIKDEGKNLSIEPIDLKTTIEKNIDKIKVIENEAIDFIGDVYKKYKKKVDKFVVSFSGGKDSQVVLDLVSRTLPPDDYIVVFTDTTMELPTTYQTFQKTKEHYQNLYPDLKFYVAKNEQPAHELWKLFGPPSRIIRWCCSVYKTAPVVRLIKNLNNDRHKHRILVFDGVRADESNMRNSYSRIAEEIKHDMQINAEVIRFWNQTEVFIYIFLRNLILNESYKFGLNRIGCGICPFGSEWSEYLIVKMFPDVANKFFEIIYDQTKKIGIENQDEIIKYISNGNWKKRAGGEGLYFNDTKFDFYELNNSKRFLISFTNNGSLNWLKTLGQIVNHKKDKKIYYEIYHQGKIYKLKLEKLGTNKYELILPDNFKDDNFLNKIRKVLYKVVYCVSCGVCEIECPNNAINLMSENKINEQLCLHCHRCLDFVDFGCIRAKSLQNYDRSKNMRKNVGFGKYQTFGMRENWFRGFINDPEHWFKNHNLGNKQFDSMIAWLRDCELIKENKKIPVEIITKFQALFADDPILCYSIIWVNLFYNSSVVNWYLTNVNWNETYSLKKLKEKAMNELNIPERTVMSGLNSLFNMFENTPYGKELKLGVIEKENKERVLIKMGNDDIHPFAVLYSIYRLAIDQKRYRLRLNEFYNGNVEGGPYLIFGISKDKLEKSLIWLQEKRRDLINVELIADLDNINLNEDISNHYDLLNLLI